MNNPMIGVNALNIKIKSLLEATFMHIKVEGEIASITYHQASGHVYFSIKDDKSSIKCVMFRSNAQRLKFRLEKGQHIVVDGSVGVYTPRGEYQFYATSIEPYGKGALALAYEQLKNRLKDRGYFDKDRKKPIPKNIESIVLVTAKDSAALHDMIKIIEKRYPLVEVTIIDTLVQGERASREIADALYHADSLGADLIVVGRGGGSAEDLWAFNEEVVADAIYRVDTPIVSAVGHEVDVMISDFVADLRAPTPSAAIEMILPDRQEMLYMLDEHIDRFGARVDQLLHIKREAVRSGAELLQQHSISRQLHKTLAQFKYLEDEYRARMEIKLDQYSSHIPRQKVYLKQQIDFILSRAKDQERILREAITLNNPRDRAKKGWAKVSMGGKTTILKSIEIGDSFVIEDSDTKIEAICQQKIDF